MRSRLDGRRPRDSHEPGASRDAHERVAAIGVRQVRLVYLFAEPIAGVSWFAASRGRQVGHDMRMTDSGSEVAVDSAVQSGTADAQVDADSAVPAAPFGEWPSPITAAAVASGQATGSFPTVQGADTWWQVGLPDEGGRTTVMHDHGGKQTMLLPSPWNARTRVHEYGGLSYLPIPPSA